MPKRSKGKRAELANWIARARPGEIGEAELANLRRLLAPVSESYLLKLLRDSGVPLAPLVEGVRQGSLEELERSLSTLAREYSSADALRRKAIRRLVITAKDHARWAARSPEKSAAKNETILWMTTWLENPSLFEDWIKLRRPRLVAQAGNKESCL